MRRRAWKPHAMNSETEVPSIIAPQEKTPFAAGEFENEGRGFVQACRRCAGLVSDLSLLILASPIFLAWWGFRVARRILNKDR
jgi:hypothetical protein